MSKRLMTGLLASWLAGSTAFAEPANAPEPLVLDLPAESAQQALENPIRPVAATSPRVKDERERPTELPNIDSRLDIKPLVGPSTEKKPEKKPTLRERLHGDYDNSLLWLPDRNPGMRQPPCPCLPLGTFWVNAAYFLGKTEDGGAPPLLTTFQPGINALRSIRGDERLDHPFRSGMRLEMGSWLDRCHNWGVDSSFFFMQATEAESLTTSDGTLVLARPFLQRPLNQTGIDMIAGPGVGRGSFLIESPLTFVGADVNSRNNLFCEDNRRLDFLAGYRYVRMSEGVSLSSHTDFLDGSTRDVVESFSTINNFHGGQIGLAGEYRCFERLYFSGFGKVAFGATWSRLSQDGVTRTNAGGLETQTPGGVLVAANESGRTYFRNFAVVPEANFNVGYQVGEHWRAYVGYTFLYVSSVARPGQALNQVMTPGSRGDINTDFWMHGINLGLEARY